jgi:putative flavoprotein involved in K+ transport
VTARPGLYVLGMPFLRRRKSTLIDGAASDAADLAAHLASYLGGWAGRRERTAS